MARDGLADLPVLRWDTSVSYDEAARRQEERVLQRSEALILCEHPPTITLGTTSKPDDLLYPIERYQQLGIPIVKSSRGGKVTCHGPGQLVVYPILDLRQRRFTIHAFLRFLEELTIRLCAEYGVTARRIDGKVVAWIVDRKIGFNGVRISKGFSFQGLSFNIIPQHEAFSRIVPCGIPGLTVTSLQEELNDNTLTQWDAADRMQAIFFDLLNNKPHS